MNNSYRIGADQRPDVSLRNGEVHIWAARIYPVKPEELDNYRSRLSEAEHKRAQRLGCDEIRNKYVATRGILRNILGHYLNAPAGKINFKFSPNGKPYISGGPNPREIKFNISHSNSLALIALTKNSEVGIDVEHVREIRKPEDIVKRFFSPDDIDFYLSMNEDCRTEAFFKLWTIIEACVKASGDGMFTGGGKSNIRTMSACSILSRKYGKLNIGERDYSVAEIDPGEQYTAAVAVEGIMPEIRRFEYGAAE